MTTPDYTRLQGQRGSTGVVEFAKSPGNMAHLQVSMPFPSVGFVALAFPDAASLGFLGSRRPQRRVPRPDHRAQNGHQTDEFSGLSAILTLACLARFSRSGCCSG